MRLPSVHSMNIPPESKQFKFRQHKDMLSRLWNELLTHKKTGLALLSMNSFLLIRHFQSSRQQNVQIWILFCLSCRCVTHLSWVLRHFDPLDVVQSGPRPHTQCNREKVGQPNIYGRWGGHMACWTKDLALTDSAASALHPDVSADSAVCVCVCVDSIECAWPELYRVNDPAHTRLL